MKQEEIKIPTCTIAITTNLTDEQEAFSAKRGTVHNGLRGMLTCIRVKKIDSPMGKQSATMIIDSFGTNIRRSIDSLASPVPQQGNQ